MAEKSAPFLQLMTDVFDSEAFQSLRPTALKIYLHLLKRRGPKNNGAIPMTSRQAMEWTGAAEGAVTSGLRELRRVGLVVRTHCADQSLEASRRGDHSMWMLTCFPYRAENGATIQPLALYVDWTADGVASFEDYELTGGVRAATENVDRQQGFKSEVAAPKPTPGPKPKAAGSKPVLRPKDPLDVKISRTTREVRPEGVFHQAFNAEGDMVGQTWTKTVGQAPDWEDATKVLDDIPF